MRPDQAERTFKKDIRYISEETYRKIVDDNYQITQSDYGAQVRIYKGARCQRNSPSSAIVDLAKTLDFRPLVNRSSWFVDFFEDGVLIETLSIKSPTDKPFVIPEIIVESGEEKGLTLFELIISKAAGTEAIEVLTDPNSPHQNLVYKVELDENSSEINRQLIHLFSSHPGQPPPEYELICDEVKECPEDTYQFDCGTYLCCYKPDGYALSRIDK